MRRHLEAIAAIDPTPEAHLLLGEAGTGKTDRLLRRAAALEASGCGADDVVIFAATAGSAEALARRAKHLGLCAAVSTPRDLALSLLASPAGRSFTGRSGRVLEPYEFDFLMEDLKPSGLRTGRLRALTGFLLRGMAGMSDCDGDWLVNDEERGVLSLMESALAFTGGILAEEVAGLAVRFVRSGEAPCAARRAHVLVDDYQLLSRSSQVLVNLVAERSIWAAADEHGSFEAGEKHPNAAGVQEFIDANGHAQVEELASCHRSAGALALMHAVRSQAGIECLGTTPASDAAEGSIAITGYPSPEAEAEAVAASVHDALASGIDPADALVVAAHPAMARLVAEALERQGVPACMGPVAPKSRHSPEARADTALKLACDPLDGVAWRSWCGFDDPLANSGAITLLRERFGKGGCITDALARAAASERAGEILPASLEGVIAAYREGLDLIALAGSSEGDGELRIAAGRSGQAPKAADADHVPGAVRICDVRRVAGLEARRLYLVGFVNGLFPVADYFDRERMPQAAAERLHARDAVAFSYLVGRARDRIEASYFTEVGLEEADRLGVRIDRIRLRDGRRMARTSPSIFLGA